MASISEGGGGSLVHVLPHLVIRTKIGVVDARLKYA